MRGAIWGLALCALQQGDPAAARAAHEESLALYRQLGAKPGIAESLSNLGRVAHEAGDEARVVGRYRECLALRREIGDQLGIAEGLEALAAALTTEDRRRAARLLGAAAVLREAIGAPLPSADRAEYDRNVAAARAHLDEQAFVAAWAEGQAMTLEQAVAYALETPAAE